MGLDVIIDDFLIHILSSLIVVSIIGAATSYYRMNKCIRQQAKDIALMRKATLVVLRLIVTDTKRLHGGNDLIDVEEIFQDLIKKEK